MLFYRAFDSEGKLKLAPTQEAARKINKDFDSWEFPTAKQEIMEVLQDLIDRANQPPAVEEITEKAEKSLQKAKSEPSYTEYSIKLDEEWAKLPILHRLQIAANLFDEVREELIKLMP
jgi:hypothetical protein